MRNPLLLVGVALIFVSTAAHAMKPSTRALPDREEWSTYLEHDLGPAVGAKAAGDTTWYGGDGVGGIVTTPGAVWDWETDSGETAEFFLDGDPVGNQFRDGWTFEDRTTRNGPAHGSGVGHWKTDGTYDFEEKKNGAFAHRATTHANDGINDGPDPIGATGDWSVWIGTNLYLNPEHCGWEQTAGHGNGWSQSITKMFNFTANAGTQLSINFDHKYAVEAGFDTNWVEVSTDGMIWTKRLNPADLGIFNGGDKTGPIPPAGQLNNTTGLGTAPVTGNQNFWVRFSLKTDAFFSDESEGGLLFYGWQLDNIQFLVGGLPSGSLSTFETNLDGWEPRRDQGFDTDLTLTTRPVGRIVPVSGIGCPLDLPCPDDCAVSGNMLMFADKDDCNVNDRFQDSYVNSKPLNVGPGSAVDGFGGRLLNGDIYLDGGDGNFDTGLAFCFIYAPFDANLCAGFWDGTGSKSGAGKVYRWSRTGFPTCNFFAQGTSTACGEFLVNVSADLPASADSVVLHVGVFSQCRSNPLCDIADAGAPFLDNIRFGVFDPEGQAIGNPTRLQYSDSFPLGNYNAHGNGSFNALTTRADGAHNFPANLGAELPDLRYVRSDTAGVETGAPNTAMYLRWRVTPGPCQTDTGTHPFFLEYPPNVWHEARMDTGGANGTGSNVAGTYMTCYFPGAEPASLPATGWGGELTGVEPCKDILPDGVFRSGTVVHYFFESRNASSGVVTGTSPPGRSFSPIGTTENYKHMWREFTALPELVGGGTGCDPNDPNDFVNDFLLIADTPSVSARARMTAFLDGFGVGYDIYDVVSTNFSDSYNGIGRRENRGNQGPRAPHNGAEAGQLEGYSCIWYYADTLDFGTLSDEEVQQVLVDTGMPTNDQQRLRGWIEGCANGAERFLVADGYGWASDIDNNSTNGPQFLLDMGMDVLDFDYEQFGLTGAGQDTRRCARIVGQAPAPAFLGDIFASGCPQNVPVDVVGVVGGGETVANFVNMVSQLDCNGAGVTNEPNWAAIIRQKAGTGNCQVTLGMSFSFARLHPLKCGALCESEDWIPGTDGSGSTPADMIASMFTWANRSIGSPIGVTPDQAPTLVTRLLGAYPNPANPSAKISYTLAQKGHVKLKIFDVSGRLVRTLVDDVRDAASEAYEVTWDGKNDKGQQIGSGVFFYQLDAPGYTSAKKLVILK